MVKSGLIAGAVMFLLALGAASLLSPLCTPCVGIFVGLAAGWLACNFEKPVEQNESFKKGAIAGAIAGGVGILGQIIAAFINASFIQPEMLNNILGQDVVSSEMLWVGQLGGAFCIGIFNVLLMAGLGVAGAAIWRAMNKNNQAAPPTNYYPPQY